ncbi:MAG: hypothetical protein Q8936_21795 [Bacillota bacterium]|nr:hypothetical protein [Bacillota bacterium]
MFSKVLPLPISFDQNEIFVVITILIGSFIVFLLPKRFPGAITILLLIEPGLVARISDHFLASPQMLGSQYDLYDILDTGKVDFFDLITYFMYSPLGYIFIYIYDRYKTKGMYFTLYIFFSSLFATAFEWSAMKFKVFTYKHWNLSFSFIAYLITLSMSILFLNLIKRLYKARSRT